MDIWTPSLQTTCVQVTFPPMHEGPKPSCQIPLAETLGALASLICPCPCPSDQTRNTFQSSIDIGRCTSSNIDRLDLSKIIQILDRFEGGAWLQVPHSGGGGGLNISCRRKKRWTRNRVQSIGLAQENNLLWELWHPWTFLHMWIVAFGSSQHSC